MTDKTSTEPRAKELSLGANTAVTAASKVVGIIVALAISPFIVHEVGLKVFGFWAFVSALTQYAALLDMGTGAALARFIAVHSKLDERQRITELSAAGFVVSWGVSLVIVLLSWVIVAALPAAWTDSWPEGWAPCVLAVSGSLACVLAASTFQAFPRGFSRWDLQALPGLAFQFGFAIATVPALLLGFGLAGLGFASLFAGIAMLVCSRAVQRKVWQQQLAIHRASWKDVVMLTRYGANLQASALVSIVNTQADKPMILAVGGSLEFVGLYELASRVAVQLRMLPMSALGPLTVKLASDTAGKTVTEARPFYEWALNGVLTLGVAPLLALYGASYALVMAWLGTGYQSSSWIAVVLGVGLAVNFATGAGTSLANGFGRPDFERNYCLLSLAINIVLSLILGLLVGPWGVVFATSIGLVVSSVWFQAQMSRWLADGASWESAAARQSAPILALGLGLGTAFVLVGRYLEDDGRWVLLLFGGFAGALTVAAFVALVPAARQMVERRFPRLRSSSAMREA